MADPDAAKLLLGGQGGHTPRASDPSSLVLGRLMSCMPKFGEVVIPILGLHTIPTACIKCDYGDYGDHLHMINMHLIII